MKTDIAFSVTGLEQTRDVEYEYDESGRVIDIIPGQIHSILVLESDGVVIKSEVDETIFRSVEHTLYGHLPEYE